MRAAELASKLPEAKRRGDYWDCRCPAHDDEHPSCSFSDGHAGIVFTCHSHGCPSKDIAAGMATRIGCKVRDFFFSENGRGQEPVATYLYTAADGTINRRVLKYVDERGKKKFIQQRPDPDHPDRWLDKVAGHPTILYHEGDLQGAAVVAYVEGEEDANRLRGLGWIATTHPMGCKAFKRAYAQQLATAMAPGGLVVVFRDDDLEGLAMQQQVVGAVYAAGLRVKRIILPDLPPIKGADVSDWLRSHTADDLAALVAATPEWTPQTDAAHEGPGVPAKKPIINTSNMELGEMAAIAWSAIEAQNMPPVVYSYGDGLAWLVATHQGPLVIERLGVAHLTHHLAEVVTFEREVKGSIKPAWPPQVLATDMVTVPRRSLPWLTRVVHVPVFLRTGQLLTKVGYDPSGLYYDPTLGLEIPPISETPTPRDVLAALELLRTELLGDFPFGSPADEVHALALLLTPFLRDCIEGCTPLFVISKPTARTGAGLLVKILSRIMTGTAAPPKTVTANEEETEKRLLAFLLPAPAVILLDNLQSKLSSASLSSVLTAYPTWAGRLLGKTLEITVPVTSVIVATGNHVQLSRELTDRSVLIWLDPDVEEPGTRTDFRHPRLEAWTAAHRGELIGACLTLGQAWVHEGMPARPPGPGFGMFEEWADTLGGVFAVIGVPGFLGNREQLRADVDEDTATQKAFLAGWWGCFGERVVATRDLLETAKTHPLPITAKDEHGTLIKLGHVIRSMVDKPYRLENVTVTVRRATGRARAAAWYLQRRGESGESDESGPRHSYARPRARAGNGGAPAAEDSQDSPHSPHSSVEEELFAAPDPPPIDPGPHGDACDCDECVPPDW